MHSHPSKHMVKAARKRFDLGQHLEKNAEKVFPYQVFGHSFPFLDLDVIS